jgi:UDPglucose 6-dehydrogenase
MVPETEPPRRISVVGLGKLGAPLAAVLASKGFEVIGVDSNPKLVADLSAGRAPVQEPGLQELLESASKPVRATMDVDAALCASDVTFVVVPTPSRADGSFNNAHILSAVRDIGTALRRKTGYHLVVVCSTVMPGSTGGAIREALEEASGRRLGDRLGLCYSPEFIALGTVIRDMTNPDFVLIGESDAHAGNVLESIYRVSCDNHPPIQRMAFIDAELAKISVNAFVTAKISFANMISELCDRLPGADAAVVTATLARDSRIGGKYLAPALGFGGPCFPRDNAAFVALARQLDAQADIPKATDSVNRRQAQRVTDLVGEVIPHGTVGILGMSYKPNTGVVEESQGIAIALRLADAGYQVLFFDPQALSAAAAVLGEKAQAVASAQECVERADLLIIATPWAEFRNLPLGALRRSGRPLPVVDCWRLLPVSEFAETVELLYPGRHRAAQGCLDLPAADENPAAAASA